MMLLGLICAAILGWWIVKFFAGTDKARIAKFGRLVGGALALATAGLLALRGRMDMAMLVGAGGGWLLGWNALPPPFGGGGATPAGAASRLRSQRIEVELDPANGRIGGRVLAGSFAGKGLDALSESDLARLHDECVAADPEGARLLEAYLDRRMPGWREHAEGHGDAGQGRAPGAGAMTQQEAYEILGLQPGADERAVREAHRGLMKRIHPDAGGTSGLAARVNQAKDVLLK